MTERELFISWLNDAYSTELAMIPVLENHANDAREYPQIYDRDMQHLEETKRQAERLETMITDLGGKVSTVKSVTGKALGLGKSVSTGMFSDELIKNFLADYAAEHLEIASYKSLIATAEHLGEHHCVSVLEEILAEEEAMAAWLKENISMATVESIKMVASDTSNGKQSKKSNGKKGFAASLLKPSGLVTLLGIGAVGAGVTMLARSSQNKTNDNQNSQSNQSIESHDNADDNLLNVTDDIEQSDVVITETLIVEEVPADRELTRATGGDSF